MIRLFPFRRLPLLLLLGVGLLAGACATQSPGENSSNAVDQDEAASSRDVDPTANTQPSGDFDPFRRAVETALEAAELNKTAQTGAEWRRVAEQWQKAIELMKAVPKSHEKYDVAQQRALEAYPQNMAYAQGRAGEDALPEFTTDDAKMTKIDFGEGWPFVVDGEVMCERISAGEYVVDLVTLNSLDYTYAVNLPAQARAQEREWRHIDEIWRDSPLGNGKVPINWVIWRGESLCDAPLANNQDENRATADEGTSSNEGDG